LDINFNLPKYTILIENLKKRFGGKLKPLGKISDVICGPFGSAIKNNDYQEKGIPLVRITNITKDGHMSYDDIVYISEELGNRLSRTQVTPGDIVISQRGSMGQCAIIDDRFFKLNISANIIALKNITEVSAEFFHNYFLSSIGQTLLERSVSGQVQQKITTQDILDLLIPIGCDEKTLNRFIDNAFTAYKAKLQQADELLAAIDDILLSSLGLYIPDYKTNLVCAVRLSNIRSDKTLSSEYYHPERMSVIDALMQSSLASKKLIDVVDFVRNIVSSENDSRKYLGLAGVQSYTGELSGVDEEAAGQAFVYQEKDVLYGRLRPYLNKVLLVEEGGICSTEFHVVRVKETAQLLPEYLAAVMRSKLVVLQTKHMMTGNTHPRISNDDVKNLLIPVPGMECQKAIVDTVRENRNKARMLRREAETEWLAAKEQFERELLGGSNT